jgi:hypothetical protein
MGQVIQGPWKPVAERQPRPLVVGMSECVIIRLRTSFAPPVPAVRNDEPDAKSGSR